MSKEEGEQLFGLLAEMKVKPKGKTPGELTHWMMQYVNYHQEEKVVLVPAVNAGQRL